VESDRVGAISEAFISFRCYQAPTNATGRWTTSACSHDSLPFFRCPLRFGSNRRLDSYSRNEVEPETFTGNSGGNGHRVHDDSKRGAHSLDRYPGLPSRSIIREPSLKEALDVDQIAARPDVAFTLPCINRAVSARSRTRSPAIDRLESLNYLRSLARRSTRTLQRCEMPPVRKRLCYQRASAGSTPSPAFGFATIEIDRTNTIPPDAFNSTLSICSELKRTAASFGVGDQEIHLNSLESV